MLALVHALKTWKHYLMGSKVLAYTDNVALSYWKTAQNLSPVTFGGLHTLACLTWKSRTSPGLPTRPQTPSLAWRPQPSVVL